MTLPRRLLLRGAIASFFVAGETQAEGRFRPFEQIDVEGSVAFARPFVVEMYGPDARGFQRSYGSRYTTSAIPGGLRLAVRRYEPAALEGPDSFRKSTWVLDYDEPGVTRLVKALRSEHGARPDPASVAHFVDRAIGDKSMTRGFDIASAVARRREGDCTEHAVLLAALLRAVGHPARLALGVLFEETRGALGAYGHAWTEVWIDGAWQGVDGTRPGRVVDARYLAGGTLSDESPSYRRHLDAVISASHPHRIVLRNA